MQLFRSSITKEEVGELPLEWYAGSIIVVDDEESFRKAMTYLEQQDLVGFDTETKPSFSKGKRNKVALMQVATFDVCFLFRLNKIGLPEELLNWLGNSSIRKIGLSLRDDFMMLSARHPGLKPAGFIDLQDYAGYFGIEVNSLQKIYGILFGKKISKAQRLSNWEAPVLTTAQQNYAALDAYACLKIYTKLSSGQVRFVSFPVDLEEDDE